MSETPTLAGTNHRGSIPGKIARSHLTCKYTAVHRELPIEWAVRLALRPSISALYLGPPALTLSTRSTNVARHGCICSAGIAGGFELLNYLCAVQVTANRLAAMARQGWQISPSVRTSVKASTAGATSLATAAAIQRDYFHSNGFWVA